MANEYVTAAEVKTALALTGTTFADGEIDRARETASRACDDYKRTKFWLDTSDQTRYFTAGGWETCLPITALTTLVSVEVDVDGDGSYSQEWTSGTDFYLDPVNAALDGLPYTELRLRDQAGRRFPTFERNVKIVGRFGWPAVPPEVEQAALFLTVRWLVRSRTAPLGLVLAEGAEAARLGRLDNEAMGLLDLVYPLKAGAGSVQLG